MPLIAPLHRQSPYRVVPNALSIALAFAHREVSPRDARRLPQRSTPPWLASCWYVTIPRKFAQRIDWPVTAITFVTAQQKHDCHAQSAIVANTAITITRNGTARQPGA